MASYACSKETLFFAVVQTFPDSLFHPQFQQFVHLLTLPWHTFYIHPFHFPCWTWGQLLWLPATCHAALLVKTALSCSWKLHQFHLLHVWVAHLVVVRYCNRLLEFWGDYFTIHKAQTTWFNPNHLMEGLATALAWRFSSWHAQGTPRWSFANLATSHLGDAGVIDKSMNCTWMEGVLITIYSEALHSGVPDVKHASLAEQ